MSLRICHQTVDDPMPMWRKYAWDYPRTIREYELGDLGDLDVLTEAEAWRSRIINSRLTNGERDQVVGGAACAPWASVQAGADPGIRQSRRVCLAW